MRSPEGERRSTRAVSAGVLLSLLFGTGAEARQEGSPPAGEPVPAASDGGAGAGDSPADSPEDPFEDPFDEDGDDPFGQTLEEKVLLVPAPLVTSVSKRAQSLRQAPANVHVISSVDLRRHGVRTVFEALQFVPGVFVSDDSEFRTIGMRGPAIIGDFNSRVLVLLDGHPLNELSRNTAAGSDLAVPIDLVERIEVSKGPGSVVHGTNAFFGVVNIVTKGASELRGGQLVASYASEDTYGGSLSYGTFVTPDLEVVVSTSASKTDGARERVRGFGDTTGEAEEKSRDAYVRITWGDFGLAARTSRHERVQAGAPYATNFDSPDNVYLDRKSWLELSWRPRLGENGTLSLRGYADRYRFDDELDYEPAFRFRDRNEARTYGVEAVVSIATSEDNTLSFGAEVQHTRAEYRSWAPGFSTTARGREDFLVLKLFAEDEVVLSDEWRLSAGVQYNRHELFDDGFSPRVALVHTPTPRDTFKAIYSEGFRNPSYIEAFFDDGSVLLQNDGLESERVRSAELVAEHEFEHGLTTSVALWGSKVTDLVRQESVVEDGRPRLQFRNTDGFEVFGVDLGASLQLDDGIRSFANVTLQDERGSHLTNYPHWIANAGLSVPVLDDRMVVAGSVHAVAERDGGEFSDDADPYALVNLTLSIRDFPVEDAETTFGVFNLLDDEVWAPTPLYFTPDLMRSQRRAVGVKVLLRF